MQENQSSGTGPQLQDIAESQWLATLSVDTEKPFVHRFRIAALFCAIALLVCELVSRPYANTGICDDGPYILVAQKLAATGHIVFNGWSGAMLICQLYLGAALIKLFGFSFTTVRVSTLLVAMALAFFLQRTMVRAGIGERNATIGTLALVLSPLYLTLSVTFMSDIHGLFAIVLCLFGCLRALQSSTTRTAIGWLCFAVTTNAICGTSRQLAWLGILVMVPSTLWLLRARRRVLLAGAIATFVGVLFILGCLHWLKHQPYTLPEHLLVSAFPVKHTLFEFFRFFLDFPFLLLPIMVLFLPEVRKSNSRTIAIVCTLVFGYLFLATYPSHFRAIFRNLREPTSQDWVNAYGGYEILAKGTHAIFLYPWMQTFLTIAAFASLIGLICSLVSSSRMSPVQDSARGISWKELGVLLAPFTIAYTLLLLSRAVTIASEGGYYVVVDRYALGLLVVALLCLIRYYQERIQLQLPLASVLMVGIMAVYGIAVTHNMFSFYRARVTLAAELHAAGIPDTSVDNGWDYNMVVELEHSDHINDPDIELPAHAYVPTPPLPAGTCPMFWYDKTPHIKPLYGASSDPDACYGPAPFPPVHYSRWLADARGSTLYVVRYTAPSKP